jgi:hypothetical protein
MDLSDTPLKPSTTSANNTHTAELRNAFRQAGINMTASEDKKNDTANATAMAQCGPPTKSKLKDVTIPNHYTKRDNLDLSMKMPAGFK